MVVSTLTSASSLGFLGSSLELVGWVGYVAYLWPLRPFADLLYNNTFAFVACFNVGHVTSVCNITKYYTTSYVILL